MAPGPFILALGRNISSKLRGGTLVQDIALSEHRSLMRPNLWLQKIKKKGRVSGRAVRRSLQRTAIISTASPSLQRVCRVSPRTGTDCELFPFIFLPFLSFHTLTRGLKERVFFRANGGLHKSQATPDWNAIDVEQPLLLHRVSV